LESLPVSSATHRLSDTRPASFPSALSPQCQALTLQVSRTPAQDLCSSQLRFWSATSSSSFFQACTVSYYPASSTRSRPRGCTVAWLEPWLCPLSSPSAATTGPCQARLSSYLRQHFLPFSFRADSNSLHLTLTLNYCTFGNRPDVHVSSELHSLWSAHVYYLVPVQNALLLQLFL